MSEDSRSRKVEEWSQRLLRFSTCSQTVVEFCRTEGVSQPSFYAWRKKLNVPGISAQSPGLADAALKAVKPVRNSSASRFAPVSFDPAITCAHPQGLKVRLPGGIELELGNDPHVIQAVVKQLVESSLQESSLQTGGPQAC